MKAGTRNPGTFALLQSSHSYLSASTGFNRAAFHAG
jgi:hypothetical protein